MFSSVRSGSELSRSHNLVVARRGSRWQGNEVAFSNGRVSFLLSDGTAVGVARLNVSFVKEIHISRFSMQLVQHIPRISPSQYESRGSRNSVLQGLDLPRRRIILNWCRYIAVTCTRCTEPVFHAQVVGLAGEFRKYLPVSFIWLGIMTLDIRNFTQSLSLRDIIVTLGAIYLTCWLCVFVYRITLHPLAKFPGPKLAGATFWYEFYYDVWPTRYRYMWKIQELHRKYGKCNHPLITSDSYRYHCQPILDEGQRTNSTDRSHSAHQPETHPHS